MDTSAQVGARVLQAREAGGFTVAARFAEKIGVRPHTLWRYEVGHIMPGPEKLLKIAALCGVSIEWLLTGQGDPPAVRTGTDG